MVRVVKIPLADLADPRCNNCYSRGYMVIKAGDKWGAYPCSCIWKAIHKIEDQEPGLQIHPTDDDLNIMEEMVQEIAANEKDVKRLPMVEEEEDDSGDN